MISIKKIRLLIALCLVTISIIFAGYELERPRVNASTTASILTQTALRKSKNITMKENYQNDVSKTPSIFLPYVRRSYLEHPRQTISSESWPFSYGKTSRHEFRIHVLILSYGSWGQDYLYSYGGKVYDHLSELTALVSTMPHFNISIWKADITAF